MADLRRRESCSIHPFEVQAGTDPGESRARRRRRRAPDLGESLARWPSKNRDPIGQSDRPSLLTNPLPTGTGGSDTDRSGMVMSAAGRVSSIKRNAALPSHWEAGLPVRPAAITGRARSPVICIIHG
jgi:hypothetical protein